MDDKKVRAVRMSDALYEQCKKTAGKNAFSPWAEHVLAQAAGTIEIQIGTIPGGLCAGSTRSGPCGRGDAWIYLNTGRVFLCSTCHDDLVSSNPTLALHMEDRRPKLTLAGHREQLIQAVKNAANALAEFDRTSASATNIPADIAASISTARHED